MTARFYQENWEVVGSEVCNAVLNSLNTGFINEDLNFTYITLIHMIRSKRKKNKNKKDENLRRVGSIASAPLCLEMNSPHLQLKPRAG
jgi:hypothetical protein